MSFWGLLLALISSGIIAVFVWAPWWAKLLMGLCLISLFALCLLEHARRPPLLMDGIEE